MLRGLSTVRDTLRELAAWCGVTTEYRDGLGAQRQASTESLLAVLRMLGVSIDSPEQAGAALAHERARRWATLCDPCLAAWHGEGAAVSVRLSVAEANGTWEVAVACEDGAERSRCGKVSELAASHETRVGGAAYVSFELPLPELPIGYHVASVCAGTRSGQCTVICAPTVAHRAPGTTAATWGVFAPTYALRGERDLGVGDLGTLSRLAAWVRTLGGSLVGTLPLLASYLDEPFEPSPYSPVSRRFWNELYLDVDRMLDDDERMQAAITHASALRRDALVDYHGAMRHKRVQLESLAEAAWADTEVRAQMERHLSSDAALGDYAVFRAAGERQQSIWRDWPAALRDGTITRDDYDERARRYHVFVQYQMSRQLLALNEEAGLYLDLPVGANRYGFDVWRDPSCFVMGASAGAPPDALFSKGQNWGLPPLHPRRIRENAYRDFAACVRAHTRHASMLRVDHVMGLHRLYWVPDGASAADGVYVSYNAPEMYAVLCLESVRHKCAIAGEDLGTVPDEVPPTMERHGFHKLHVAQFEPIGQAAATDAPHSAVASLNTHDMPTFAGFWRADDVDVMTEIGLLDQAAAEAAKQDRAHMRRAAAESLGEESGEIEPRRVMRSITGRLAASDAQIVLVTLEDLWLEPAPQNVPGTGAERPNWRRKMSRTVEQITGSHELAGMLREVNIRRPTWHEPCAADEPCADDE